MNEFVINPEDFPTYILVTDAMLFEAGVDLFDSVLCGLGRLPLSPITGLGRCAFNYSAYQVLPRS
jgi:hypothetical protein